MRPSAVRALLRDGSNATHVLPLSSLTLTATAAALVAISGCTSGASADGGKRAPASNASANASPASGAAAAPDGSGDPGPLTSSSGAPALPGYHAAAGAPTVCTTLASAPHVGGVPNALAVLVKTPGESAAASTVRAAAAELDAAVKAGSTSTRTSATFTGNLTGLAGLLRQAAATETPDPRTLMSIASSLTSLGKQAGTVCEFPK